MCRCGHSRLKLWCVCVAFFAFLVLLMKRGKTNWLNRGWNKAIITDTRENYYKNNLSISIVPTSTVLMSSWNDADLFGFDVRKANLKFLPDFKNPCWLESYSSGDVYKKNLFFSTQPYPKRIWKSKFRNLQASGMTYENHTLCNSATGKCRLRCLPYFMLLGVHKSGSTDFYNRLDMHPHVFSSIEKEVFWWNQLRFQKMLGASLGDYADLFDDSVEKLKSYKRKDNTNTESYDYPSILGEYTAMTFFDMSYWRQDPDNKRQIEPVVTTPFDVYHVNPDMKLMVLLRNPTNRLYSHYNYFTTNSSPEDFHTRVLGSIWWWKTCREGRALPRRNCAYGSPPEMPPVYDELGKPYMWWSNRFNYSGEIRTGMYSIHAREWLNVFPKSSMLFLKMEEYSVDMAKAFRQLVFPFLGIEEPHKDIMEIISTKAAALKNSYKPMLNESRDILNEFYRPFNKDLAELLGDQKWLWKT